MEILVTKDTNQIILTKKIITTLTTTDKETTQTISKKITISNKTTKITLSTYLDLKINNSNKTNKINKMFKSNSKNLILWMIFNKTIKTPKMKLLYKNTMTAMTTIMTKPLIKYIMMIMIKTLNG